MNRSVLFGMLSIAMLLLMVTTTMAQRQDVIWARNAAGATITMDGVLNEPAWASAEEVQIIYGQSAGLPTSGWRPEFQEEAYFDQTNATVKFLVSGSDLWLGFDMADSSVGGIQDWARWDGILMSVRDRASSNRPTPAVEFFYTWWYVNIEPMIVPGAPPRFIGRYGNFDDTTRTAAQRAAWDARTVVHGVSNDDTTPDQGWTVEMRVNLDSLGYDVNLPGGEVVELNFSIWDGDWVFSGDPFRIASARTWWQSPWGNADANNVARVNVRSDVTINSGAVPAVGPDVVVFNAANHAAPTIDGALNETAWQDAYTFDIRWDDAALRNTYPGVGKYRSGQFQPEINGVRAPIVDPSDATIKMFVKDDFLYLAADVRDAIVVGTSTFDLIDGVRFIIADRGQVNEEHIPFSRRLLVNFDATGAPGAFEYLTTMVDSSSSEYAVALKGATTVNNNNDVDEGYTIEIKADLAYLGYPAGLGDHLLFMGVMLADGDQFQDPLNDYGARTWWFREHDGGPAYAWMVMSPVAGGIGDNPQALVPNAIQLHGNYPNPFNPSTTIRYTIPFSGNVELLVYNILGQQVASVAASKQAAGVNTLNFEGHNLSSGIYFYKVRAKNVSSGETLDSKAAKMVLIK